MKILRTNVTTICDLSPTRKQRENDSNLEKNKSEKKKKKKNGRRAKNSWWKRKRD